MLALGVVIHLHCYCIIYYTFVKRTTKNEINFIIYYYLKLFIKKAKTTTTNKQQHKKQTTTKKTSSSFFPLLYYINGYYKMRLKTHCNMQHWKADDNKEGGDRTNTALANTDGGQGRGWSNHEQGQADRSKGQPCSPPRAVWGRKGWMLLSIFLFLDGSLD